MSEPDPGQPRSPAASPAGLCDSCRYMRLVHGGKGTAYIFCERSTIDPTFPKYPRLPVIRCTGYSRVETEQGNEGRQPDTEE